MMNEINALVWPAPQGIGLMNKADYSRTASIAKRFAKLKKTPGQEAYRTDLARAAQAMLRRQGIDLTGKKWRKAAVKVTAGGK
jgi:NitT/TauT family transport system substrate-binding protein